MNNQPKFVSGNQIPSAGLLECSWRLVTIWIHKYILPAIFPHSLVPYQMMLIQMIAIGLPNGIYSYDYELSLQYFLAVI